MRKEWNRLLIRLSIRPYKTVKLESGLLVDVYKNGKIRADKRDVKGRVTKKTTFHG